MDWPGGDDPDYEPHHSPTGRRTAVGTPEGHAPHHGFRSVSAPMHRLADIQPADEPIICQVEGCTKDIRQEKEYYQRYRICEEHLKLGSLLKDGIPQRFCQQCGRFHELSEFDGDKRSCRERLSLHNNRRRKRGTASAGGDGGGRGRRARMRQRRAPALLQERRGAQPEELQQPHMGSLPRLLPQPGFRPPDDNGMTLGSAGSSYAMLSGGMRRSSESLLQRAQSMSEAAGFQAPPELINAMELLAGEAPYPAPADTAAPGSRGMLRHRSLTDEPVLAFGGAMPLAEGEQRDLHKSASDPTHIIHGLHGMGSLTWADLTALGHSGVPPAMRTAIESGFRLEPRMLQQYANMQQQSPMPSVRIPSAPHDSGGLYNPFNMGPLIPGAGSSEGLGPQPPRDMSHQVKHPSLQRASDSSIPLRFNSSESMQTTSADTMQRWSSHEGLGPRLSTHFSAEAGIGRRLSSQEAASLGRRLSSQEAAGGLGSRLASIDSTFLGQRHPSGMSSMSTSSEAQLSRAFSGGPALDRPFARHSSADVSRMPPRPPGPQSAGVRRASPTSLAARIAASSEHLLGPGDTVLPEDAPFEGDGGRLSRQHSSGPVRTPTVTTGAHSGFQTFSFGSAAGAGFPAGGAGGGFGLGHGGGDGHAAAGIGGSGIAGSGLAYNPFSTRSDPVLAQRSRAAYAQMQRDAAADLPASAGLAPVYDDDEEYEGLDRPSAGGAGGISGGHTCNPGSVAQQQQQQQQQQRFSLPPPVSRTSMPSPVSSPHPQPTTPPGGAPPGGGFTVTTGIDPRMHTGHDPLQARLRALAESVTRRAQQEQEQQRRAGAEMSHDTGNLSPDGSLGGQSSAEMPPQPQAPPLQQAQQQLQQAQQQQARLPDVFQWGSM